MFDPEEKNIYKF